MRGSTLVCALCTELRSLESQCPSKPASPCLPCKGTKVAARRLAKVAAEPPLTSRSDTLAVSGRGQLRVGRGVGLFDRSPMRKPAEISSLYHCRCHDPIPPTHGTSCNQLFCCRKLRAPTCNWVDGCNKWYGRQLCLHRLSRRRRVDAAIAGRYSDTRTRSDPFQQNSVQLAAWFPLISHDCATRWICTTGQCL